MITLLYFGQIQSITTLPQEQLSFTGTIEALRSMLKEKYPKLESSHFVISVNKKISTDGTINDQDEVALMPPFSGG